MSETRNQKPETRNQSKGRNPLTLVKKIVKKILECFFERYDLNYGGGYDICIKNTNIIVHKKRFDRLAQLRYRDDLSLEEETEIIQTVYHDTHNEYLNLTEPKTLNEKINWLKLHYRDPLIIKCSDKYAVREYVKEKIGEEYLVSLLGVWDKVDDVDFDALPNQFVLKVNWGSGQNIIVKDKSTANIPEIKKQLERWMRYDCNHSRYSMEWGYKDVTPKITAEEFISEFETESPPDYKFHCVNGEPKLMNCMINRGYKNYIRSTFSLPKYDFLPVKLNKIDISPELPNSIEELDKLVDISKKLSKDFPFVRVDLYIVKDKIYFGELTFYPAAGTGVYSPNEYNTIFGDMIVLPKNKL